MIDFHTHSFFSDGELIPSELVRRAKYIGYEAIAITDHVDTSNFDFVVPRIIRVAEDLNKINSIKVIAGAEITHVPPPLIKDLAAKIRDLGAKLIIVHGETIAEPVEEGTNRSAVESDIDILAHPGLLDEETCEIAKKNGIFFEITSRMGHSLTNGHVAKMANKHGINMVLNSDSHSSSDLLTREHSEKTLRGAGLEGNDIEKIIMNSKIILNRVL